MSEFKCNMSLHIVCFTNDSCEYVLSLCGDGISALESVQLSHDGGGVVLNRSAALCW